MKKLIGILVLGLLWCNLGFSKIINIENRVRLEVPNNYEYIELESIPDTMSATEDIVGQDAKIFLVGTKKSINFTQLYIESQEELYEPIEEKMEQKNFKSQKQMEKFIGSELNKLFKKHKYEGVIGVMFSNETIDQMGDNELIDLVEDMRNMSNSELKKEMNKYKREINDWLYNEIGEELRNWVKIKKFKVGKNKYNDPFGVITVSYKIPPLKGQTTIYTFIKDNMVVVAYYECLNCSVKAGSIEKIFKPTFSANEIKETPTSKSDLTDQIKTLNELYKEGALTKEEFEKAKKKLLN